MKNAKERLTRSLMVATLFFASYGFGSPPALRAGTVSLDVYQTLNVLSIQEAAGDVMLALRKSGGFLQDGAVLTTSGTYSDAGWTYSIGGTENGQSFAMNFSGSLSGTAGQTITDSYTATGSLGTSWNFDSFGSSTFTYDSTSNSYTGLNFTGEVDYSPSLGASSFLHWLIAGAEILVGGGIGSLVPGVGTVGGAGVALAASSVGMSQGIAPPPPNPPPLPTGLKGLPDFVPSDGSTYSYVTGPALGSVMFVATSGFVESDVYTSDGSFTGTAMAVPEPSSFVLTLLGIGSAFLWIKKAKLPV